MRIRCVGGLGEPLRRWAMLEVEKGEEGIPLERWIGFWVSLQRDRIVREIEFGVLHRST